MAGPELSLTSSVCKFHWRFLLHLRPGPWQERNDKQFRGFNILGVCIEFGLIFLQFDSFITVKLIHKYSDALWPTAHGPLTNNSAVIITLTAVCSWGNEMMDQEQGGQILYKSV